MVKNEMDIIESFVRHTLGFADLLIIADHKSTDRTREILEALQAEGLPIIIEDVAAARHMQAETMTHLLWEAADDYGADLILPLDADEFLVPAGRAPVRDVLNMVPIDDVRSLLWRRCIPVSEDGISSGKFALSVPLLLNFPTPNFQAIPVHICSERQTSPTVNFSRVLCFPRTGRPAACRTAS